MGLLQNYLRKLQAERQYKKAVQKLETRTKQGSNPPKRSMREIIYEHHKFILED